MESTAALASGILVQHYARSSGNISASSKQCCLKLYKKFTFASVVYVPEHASKASAEQQTAEAIGNLSSPLLTTPISDLEFISLIKCFCCTAVYS
jgi:hypothetical protein